MIPWKAWNSTMPSQMILAASHSVSASTLSKQRCYEDLQNALCCEVKSCSSALGSIAPVYNALPVSILHLKEVPCECRI